MLALVEVVADLLPLTPIVVVHEHQLPGHRVVEILLAHQCVRTEHYLILIWDKYTFIKVVAHYKFHIVLFQDHVVLEQGIAHSFPEFVVLSVLAQMLLSL